MGLLLGPGFAFRTLLVSFITIGLSVVVVVIVVYNTDDGPKLVPTPVVSTPAPVVSTPQPILGPVVDVTCGRVIGTKVMVNTSDGQTKECNVFTNIPYAAPPVGGRRWKRPVSLLDEPSFCWSGYYYANGTDTKRCPQARVNVVTQDVQDIFDKEDCLFLSVRSPDITGKRPVMVWIHGGYLMHGYSENPGYSTNAEFAASLDVVTVNVNYRLSALGFLSLQELWMETDPKSFGNYGFFDQIAALRWVKQNIAKFGGDPDSVTIFGHSAGGLSVVGLLNSPLANGLFHRAIALSAPPLWRTDRIRAKERNMKIFLGTLARLDSNCSGVPVLTCLNQTSVANLVRANLAYFQFALDFGQLPRPLEDIALNQAVLDSVVVPKNPASLACANFQTANNIPVLIGSMAQEVNGQPLKNYLLNETEKMYNETMIRLAGFNISFEQLFALYPSVSAENITLHPQKVWETMVSDLRVTCPTNTLVSKLSESSQHTVYRMMIEHAPSSGLNGRLTNAHHEWDTQAAFNFIQKTRFGWAPTTHDSELRDELRRIFKEFVTGTVKGGWKPYPQNHLVIRNQAPYVEIVEEANAKSSHCKFWDDNGFGRFAWQN